MLKTLLLIGLYGLGVSAVLIGSLMALSGPHVVGSFFNTLLGLSRSYGPVTDLASANVESEMRFYGIMFVFYGGVLIHTAATYKIHAYRVPILLAVFFFAGVARAIGYITVGPPHPLFVLLLTIEIGLPIILFLCWWLENRS